MKWARDAARLPSPQAVIQGSGDTEQRQGRHGTGNGVGGERHLNGDGKRSSCMAEKGSNGHPDAFGQRLVAAPGRLKGKTVLKVLA
jgi:hypothetical protein